MPWLSLAGYCLLIVVYGATLSPVLPAAWQRPFMQLLLIVPILLILAKDLACFPLSVQRFRTARALTPPEFLSCLRLERAMWRGFFSWLLRRPQPVRPSGIALGYLERGAYGTVICCVLHADSVGLRWTRLPVANA